MVKQTSALDDLLDDVLDIVRRNWPLGAFISGLSFLATLASLDWALTRYLDHTSSDGSFISGFVEHLGWIYFGLPVLVLSLTFIFSVATLRAYQHDHRL